MQALFNSVVIYTRDMQKTADFYRRVFGFNTIGEVVEGLI